MQKIKENWTDSQIATACAWLKLAIAALAWAGLYAVLLVLGRADWMTGILPIKDLFHTALVIHVNLSVLVWLLAFLCLFITLSITSGIRFILLLSCYLSFSGALLFSLSPLIQDSAPLQNNYVPVLDGMPFFFGLALFALGCLPPLIMGTLSGFNSLWQRQEISPIRACAFYASFCGIAAFLALARSYVQLTHVTAQHVIGSEEYYEMLFWGGGHILQFAYLFLLFAAWQWIAQTCKLRLPFNARILHILLGLSFLPVLFTADPYVNYSITSYEHRDFFTQQMRLGGGGVTALFLGLPLLWELIRGKARGTHPSQHALFWSILLFGVGGVIGFAITDTNTTIPAHYHGSIVGVTLALNGLTYILLPQLGYRLVSYRWAAIQAWLYGMGQMMHVIGLAWSGGYGALRKTPGAMESIEGQTAMGLMGMGGLLSTLGGLLFVILCLLAMRERKKNLAS